VLVIGWAADDRKRTFTRVEPACCWGLSEGADKKSTTSLICSGTFRAGVWPQPSIVTSRHHGPRRVMAWAVSGSQERVQMIALRLSECS
jgi:hypothetical protein